MEATYQLNESEFAVSMPYCDVARLADALDKEEPIDLMAELEKFRILSVRKI